MSNEKKNKKDDSTRRLNSEEVNKRAKNKNTKTSSKTQVVSKVNLDEESKKSKKKNNKDDNKKKKKFKERHPRIVTIIRIILILILLCIIIAAGIIFGAIWGGYNFFDLFGDDYKINMEDLVVGSENSIVYDGDGNEIANLSSGAKRVSVTLKEMSTYLPKAYVAIEDERFYEHSGVDFKRTAAATFTYITHGGKSSFGGSTITQQVVKNITNDKEDTASRKVKEMVKALQVEHYLSKEQILELYLNLIFVGGTDVNGVSLGAVYYFNKDVKDLSLAECAYMAAINNSPNSYNPFVEDEAKKEARIEKGQKRAKTVLAKMKDLKYITKEEYDSAVEEVNNGLKFDNGDTSITTLVSYQVEAALDEILTQMVEETGVSREFAQAKLFGSGYKIYTTERSGVQARLEEEMKKDYYKLPSKTGKPSMASMTIIDPHTGSVIASSAGIGEEKTKTYFNYFNYVTDLKKQTGSSIKPIAIIAAGLENKKITGSTVFYDGPTTFPGVFKKGGGLKTFKNEGPYTNNYMTLREAIKLSQNIPNLKGISTIGVQNSADFCQKIGIDDVTGKEGVVLALGALTHGASTVQMAAAYAAISNDGVYIEPTFYFKVTDKSDNIIIQPKSVEERSKRVMTSQNAYIVKNIMIGPTTAGGTAPYARIDGMDVAAKTGTTDDNYDRWLVEFTNYYAAACWYGYELNEEVHWPSYKSWNPAGTLCSNVMKDIHAGLPESRFVEPKGIVKKTACKYSGMLAGEGCSDVYQEIYTEGNMPGVCNKHQNVKICNETGLLASEFCQNYSEQYRVGIPDSEANGVWTTTFANGVENTATMPTETCPHGADSYPYED